MAVKSKQHSSEFGSIPLDWETPTAGAIVEPNAPIRYGVVQVGRDTNGGVPIVAIKYVKEIATSPLHRAAPAIEKVYSRSRVKGGDVLISIKGTIGRVGLVPEGFVGNISRELARLRLKPEFVPEFVAQQLDAPQTQARIARAIVGTTRQEFSIATLREFQIPVPEDRDEQRAVAEALSDVDELLAGLDRLIAKKRDLKQAAMQQLLTGQTRLPGFHDKWEVAAFAAVLAPLNAKAYQIQTSDYQTSGRFPVVDQGKERVVGFSDRAEKLFRCPDGGVIVFGDHTCIVKFIDFDFLVGADGTRVLRGKARQNTRFHALQLQYRGIEPTGYNRHFKFLKERDFVIPPLTEQVAIAAVLSEMDVELSALEARRAKTHALKQAMMQELLTGRTRLV